MSVLALLGFALLFVVFGAMRLGDRERRCTGCPHSGGCAGGCHMGDPESEP